MEATHMKNARRAVTAAALITLAAAIGFAAAFQLSKASVISDISPFAEDPADAVASIGFQVALAGALISAVRWARLAGDPEFSTARARLILPGCELAAAAVGVTVVIDVIAVVGSPLPGQSPWEAALIGGLAVVGMLGAAAGLATLAVMRELRGLAAGESLPARPTLADLIEDGLVVVGRVAGAIGRRIPAVGVVLEWSSRRTQRAWSWLNRSWVSPRLHPWRFVVSVALLCGAWLLAAKFLIEGEAPNLSIGVMVAVLYMGVELIAVLGGYLILGRWLGIRPPLSRNGRDFLIFYVSIVTMITGCCVLVSSPGSLAASHPSDASLISRYYRNKDDFEKLAQLLVETDRPLFIRPSRGECEFANSMPVHEASNEPCSQFALFSRKLGIIVIHDKNDMVVLPVSYSGLSVSGSEKGYAYLDKIPPEYGTLVNSTRSIPDFPMPLLRQIEGAWYIYFDNS